MENSYIVDSPQPHTHSLLFDTKFYSTSNRNITNKSNKFQLFEYKSEESENIGFVSPRILGDALKSFWKDVIPLIKPDEHILFITRIVLDNSHVISLGQLEKLSKCDFDFIYNNLISLLYLKSDSYQNQPFKSIYFNYSINEGAIDPRKKEVNRNIPTLNYYHYKLPITFDPLEYGDILTKHEELTIAHLKSGNTAVIKTIENQNEVKIFRNGSLVLEYIDKKTSDNSFIRSLGRNTYYYINNKQVLVQSTKKTKAIPIKRSEKEMNTDFITMDLETMVIDNKHIPYCVGVFDGNLQKCFYLFEEVISKIQIQC